MNYFAYGSVLSKRHVGEWAGEHGVDARLFARGIPAVLRGYKVESDGKTHDAKAYVARPEKRTEEGPPSGRLIGYLVEGAKERGLPEEWVAKLEALQAQAAPVQGVPGRVSLKVDVKPGQ